MISINESNPRINSIQTQHITFVGERINKVIRFYIEIFKYLQILDSKKRIRNQNVNKKIKAIKTNINIGDYKSLLHAIVKKGDIRIKNEDDLYLIRYKNNRKREAYNISSIISLLQDLLLDYTNILSIEFETDHNRTKQVYEDYKIKYAPVFFLVKRIFDYDEWFNKLDVNESWGPYQLTTELDLNSCPYCNRQYTFTISNTTGRKIAKPELDHFMPQAQNPLLSLSFYNLIPSCHVCNSSGVKGSKTIDYEKNWNPYEKNEKHTLMRFTYIPKSYEAAIGKKDDLEIIIKYNGDPNNNLMKSKIEGNIELFCINELYKNHNDHVREIILKRHISNDKYIEILQKTFSGFPTHIDDAYKIAFGNYYNEKEFSKRPLSKLTKDIAIELSSLIQFK